MFLKGIYGEQDLQWVTAFFCRMEYAPPFLHESGVTELSLLNEQIQKEKKSVISTVLKAEIMQAYFMSGGGATTYGYRH